MTHSMTAFARAERQVGASVLCWELKSVNHRYLDVSFRLPDTCRLLEAQLRPLLQGHVSRGKLECQLKINDMVSEQASLSLNEALVRQLVDTSAALASRWPLADDLTTSHVLMWPGVVCASELDITMWASSILELFQEALMQLVSARAAEGATLNAHVNHRLQLLHGEVVDARAHVSSMAHQTREKLLSRIDQLQMEVTDARIEQEIALILVRLDVSEELDRLETHVHEVARTLECDAVAGRRLDFLMQELNREANTLSSKSDSVVLTQKAVQMKVLIEQMREQIQNIE